MILHYWDHPHIGRIEEVLCRSHDSEVLAALRVLGIGSMATDDSSGTPCARCRAGHTPPRQFLRERYGR